MTDLMKRAGDLSYDLQRVNSGQPPIIVGAPDLLVGFKQFLERHPQLTPDTQNMLQLLPALLELQAQKAAVYGRSYCRHGDLSIFLNTERKWDRISNIMEKAMKTGMDSLYTQGTPTEMFLDTVVDLASYGLLWVGYIMETHPEAFQEFLETNQLNNSVSGYNIVGVANSRGVVGDKGEISMENTRGYMDTRGLDS